MKLKIVNTVYFLVLLYVSILLLLLGIPENQCKLRESPRVNKNSIHSFSLILTQTSTLFLTSTSTLTVI